jgi:IS5 family transposase
MKMKQLNLLAEDNRLVRLSDLGDPLERIKGVIDWEIFRPVLNKAFKKQSKGPGGRPPYDRVLMFKIVMLQQWYNIADQQTEFQINDRLSFQRFLGLSLNDRVPDEKSIWLFKDCLKNNGYDKQLFDLFTNILESSGIMTREGSIIDASFTEVPRQRNTREENQTIKSDKIPENWKIKNKATVNKVRQKDMDARWTKKNNQNFYGYKNHAKVDADSKLIVDYDVTPANVHDSQVFESLLDAEDKKVWADSAYTGQDIHESINKKFPNIELLVCEKGYKNSPLTEDQKAENRKKSKVRSRVEHVFGHMTKSMNGMNLRSIGIKRARRDIGMKNLAYNISRWVYLVNSKTVGCG